MNRSIRRRLRAGQRAIQERLSEAEGGREPRGTGGPAFTARTVRYELSERVRAIPWGGIGAMGVDHAFVGSHGCEFAPTGSFTGIPPREEFAEDLNPRDRVIEHVMRVCVVCAQFRRPSVAPSFSAASPRARPARAGHRASGRRSCSRGRLRVPADSRVGSGCAARPLRECCAQRTRESARSSSATRV